LNFRKIDSTQYWIRKHSIPTQSRQGGIAFCPGIPGGSEDFSHSIPLFWGSAEKEKFFYGGREYKPEKRETEGIRRGARPSVRRSIPVFTDPPIHIFTNRYRMSLRYFSVRDLEKRDRVTVIVSNILISFNKTDSRPRGIQRDHPGSSGIQSGRPDLGLSP
jgi:hypothetical protein